MKVKVTHGMRDFSNDIAAASKKVRPRLGGVVREAVKVGNMLARDFARESAGEHGKLYPRSFSGSLGQWQQVFGLGVLSGEYGPDAAKPQGNMSFEGGSRNQKPHLDLARSQDIIGPAFGKEVHDATDGILW